MTLNARPNVDMMAITVKVDQIQRQDTIDTAQARSYIVVVRGVSEVRNISCLLLTADS